MNNNDIMRRYKYALNLSGNDVLKAYHLAGWDVDHAWVDACLKKEGDDGFYECSDGDLGAFLDGVLYLRRGRRDGTVDSPGELTLSNNLILKKIRVALSLQDADIVDILDLSGFKVTRSGLNAIFRKPGHPNFKECGDQLLRKFLNGLTEKFRK